VDEILLKYLDEALDEYYERINFNKEIRLEIYE
jgi:hypothetical protein